MDSYSSKVLYLAVVLFLFLAYANTLFFFMYNLPFGMIDLDRYLFYLGDKDPRIVHDDFNPFSNPKYVVFYTLASLFGQPRIFFVWFPPLLISILFYLIYHIYSLDSKDRVAYWKVLVFFFMTFNILLFYVAALYRQLMAMVFLFAGFLIFKRHRVLGMSLILLGFATHVNLLPIVFLYSGSMAVSKKRFVLALSLLFLSFLLLFLTGTYDGVSVFLSSPQPSLYMLLFTCTNPFIWYYSLKDWRFDIRHILFLLLLVSMPFSDQGRGMIFLHLVAVDLAVDSFLASDEPRRVKVLLLVLGFLWYMDLIGFFLRSFIIDSFERGLDLSLLIRGLGVERAIFLR